MGVRDASQEVDECSRPDAEALLATAKLVFAIDDEEQLILVRVDV
ncbi:MAG TPA: hypothetical protein VFZ00_15120 [Solirubrobacter sp.]|nr:hypothetical protein [Solirubrobacter sp.]